MVSMDIDLRPFSVDRAPLTHDETECECTFYVTNSMIDKLMVDGPPWKFYNADLLDQGIVNPTVVFHGLQRDGFRDNCYCYTSDVPHRYNDFGVLEPMPPDRLFLIFVRRERGMIVFDWEFREADEHRLGFPRDYASDFGEPVWVRQQ
ncbi:MAG: hypothetical protein KY476_03500 [Planctomycetes bacterium]|nr:hypothetical protein [Planctomycetota bacterium]